MAPDDQLPADSESAGRQTPACPDADRPLIIRSEDLLQGRREVWITHSDEMYRLRVTSSGRLYLTK